MDMKTKADMSRVMEEAIADERGWRIERLLSSDLVHGGYTFAELNGVFDVVKDQTNWKNPISTLIPRKDDMLDLIIASVEFFTATTPTVMAMGEYYLIESPGYYAGPAGDH